MGTIGHAYGSEFHLLRFLGYHRDALNRAIEDAIPGSSVMEWLNLDFEASPAAIAKEPPRALDREFEGLDFLPDPERTRLMRLLPNVWPTTGSLPNWDAVGRIRVAGEDAWLIVEAKSHLAELRSTCGAKPEDQGGGRDRIIRTFQQTQAKLGITAGPDAWLSPYYQFCNRVAFLQFLTEQGVPARLLFVYFLGDRFPEGRSEVCPESVPGWLPHLEAMGQRIGWSDSEENALAPHVHKMFLPVCPQPVPPRPTTDESFHGAKPPDPRRAT